MTLLSCSDVFTATSGQLGYASGSQQTGSGSGCDGPRLQGSASFAGIAAALWHRPVSSPAVWQYAHETAASPSGAALPFPAAAFGWGLQPCVLVPSPCAAAAPSPNPSSAASEPCLCAPPPGCAVRDFRLAAGGGEAGSRAGTSVGTSSGGLSGWRCGEHCSRAAAPPASGADRQDSIADAANAAARKGHAALP